MEIKNAVIESVDIGTRQFISKGSVIVAKVMFDTGDSSGKAIPKGLLVQLPDDCVGQWLRNFFEAVGIGSLWEGNDTAVRLRINESSKELLSIGHIIKDIWFNPYDLRKDSAA